MLPQDDEPERAPWLAPSRRRRLRPASTSPTVRVLREELGDQVLRVDEFRGDLAITVVAQGLGRRPRTLLRSHPELDYKLFLDLCGVDYLDKDDHDDRYEVVLHAYSVSNKHHVRLKTSLPENDPTVDTPDRRLQGSQLVRARGLGPLRHRLQGPPEPRAAS